MNGNTELSASYKSYKMSIVNANPIFNDFEFEDVNSTTLALTGNNKINVNGYSTIQATISTINKAIAQKNATMSKYRFSIGDTTRDIAYNSTNDVSATISNASSGTYNMYAIDSRNNSTLVTKLANQVINYEKLYIDKQNTSIIRNNNQVGTSAILSLRGTFWNNNFGNVTNSITVSYKLKKTTSSTWIDGTTTITPTISDNNFTFNGSIASDNQDTTWDLDSSYNIKIIVTDELETVEYDLILNSGIPTMSMDKNGVGIMCAYDSSLGGALQVAGKIVDGLDYYSTEEQVVGIWTDSKPLYRKTYSFNTWGSHSTGFASGQISVKRIYGYATNGNITVPAPSYQDNWNVKVAILSSGTTIECTDGGARPAYNEMCVTIEYTKTTD